MKVKVCMGTSCVMNGAMELWDQIASINELIEENPEDYKVDRIELEGLKCIQNCKDEEEFKKCIVFVEDQLIKAQNRIIIEEIMKMIRN